MTNYRILSRAFLLSAAALGTISISVPSTGFAHEEDSRVAIELESPAEISAGVVVVEFQLIDTKANTVLTPTELNVIHEKKLHFLAYDPALKEFQHVHPEFIGGVWKADLNFLVNGNYFIWVQGEISSDSEEFSSLERLQVKDGAQEWPLPTLADVRTGKESGSVATLSNQTFHAGQMAMLTLKFTREDGSPPQITPYLGAFAHVITVPEDGDSLIHVHPMSSGKPDEGMLHATFPKAGYYRLWVQFQDAAQIKTIPLSVEVK